MTRFDALNPEILKVVARQIGATHARVRRAFPIVEETERAPRQDRGYALARTQLDSIAETMKVETLKPEAFNLTPVQAEDISSLAGYVTDTGFWRHQLRDSEGQTVACAESREATSDEQEAAGVSRVVIRVSKDTLSESLNRAIAYLDRKERQNAQLQAPDLVVRLLSIPGRRTHVLYLFSATNPDTEYVVVVSAPYLARKTSFRLIPPGKFLARLLRKTKPVVFPKRAE